MPSPFPGMDPYLEARNLWRGVHLQLINDIAADLQPQLIPRYVARPEERVLLGPLEEPMEPDVSIRESAAASRTSSRAALAIPLADVVVPEIIVVPDLSIPHRLIEIRDTRNHQVVTVIEVLSPWNKAGRGLEKYRERQDLLLASEASLVEIDLLRRGSHAVAVPREHLRPSDYRICVHRAGSDEFEVVRFGLRDPLPNFPVPLRAEDTDVILYLGRAFTRCYEEGAYAYVVDYRSEPDPPLGVDDAEWARQLVRGFPRDRTR